MNTELEVLKNGSVTPGSPLGLTQLRQAVAATREKGRKKWETVESLRHPAGFSRVR